MRNILLELFPWELQLPCAPLTLKQDVAVCPEGADHDSGPVCARAAIASTCRAAGTSATAKIRSASGRSVAGRPGGLGARPNIARTPRLNAATPRRNESTVDGRRPRPRPLRTQTLPRAWSRSRKFFPLPICDRPGCYERPVSSARNPAHYCCVACRQAVRNVQDRERKWLSRGTLDGRKKRAHEYRAARQSRSPQLGQTSATRPGAAASGMSDSVRACRSSIIACS